jgi:hypothetical protein
VRWSASSRNGKTVARTADLRQPIGCAVVRTPLRLLKTPRANLDRL